MKTFRDMSIQKKLMVANILSYLLVSLVVSGFFVFSEISSARKTIVEDLSGLAQVVGFNLEAPLEFMDRKTAEEVLSSLSVKPHILQARVYADTTLFAEYRSPQASDHDSQELSAAITTHRITLGKKSFHIEQDDIDVAVPVGPADSPLGTIILQSDGSAFRAISIRLFFVVCGIVAGSLLLALFFLRLISRYISQPVLTLADTMVNISTEEDYSLRALKTSDDELGVLITGVNSMLEGLEQRDAQLLIAKQEAEDANRAKSQFLAQMSHEIRTPMNGVLGIATLLLKTELDEKQRSFVKTIYRSGESLLNLINDILDFSKIEAGKLALERVHFNLRELVEDTVDLFSNRASEQNVHLSCFVQASLPAYVVGDPGRLRQILMNLLGNALKFTRNGEVSLKIFSDTGDGLSEIPLRFEVQDSGIGIARKKQDEIFSVFSQADGSTTRKFGGTGLGLAICRQLVELMGGTIGVESEEGEGSLFWFTVALPVGLEEEAVRLSDGSEPVDNPEKFSGRVLLAEDNLTNQIVARGMFEQAGIQVDLVENGEEAISAFGQNSYDLIFMDCQMPVMDGYEATGIIRDMEQQNGSSHVPIIAFTAHAMKGDREQCLSVGMDDHLAKPFTERQLHGVLQRWLGKPYPEWIADGKTEEEESEIPERLPEVVDLSMLESYRAYQQEGEPDIVKGLVAVYLKNGAELLCDMEDAKEQCNVEQLWKLAHTLKSSSANVGAKVLARLCEKMELQGRNNQLDGFYELPEEIAMEFAKVCEVLKPLVSE